MATKASTYFFVIIILVACGSSSKTTSSVKRQDQRDIDSLLLVRSLPVKISGKDSLFRMDIQLLLNDSLKARNFDCLNYRDATALSKKFMEDFFGVNNKQRMLDNMENIKKDKQYLLKEIEFVQPIMQTVQISPCDTEPANCIVAKRFNFPNGRKQKSWEFKYEQSESINHLASRIIDSLTGH